MSGLHCTKCSNDLHLEKHDTSTGKNGKKYDRYLFVCLTHDVWIQLEEPLETEEENEEEPEKEEEE